VAAEPKTVLYVAWAPFFSGAERALLLTASHLDPARYRPVVALGTDGDLAKEFRAAGVPTVITPIQYSGLANVLPWMRSIWGIARVARAHRAAILHSNDLPSFQPVGYAARLTGLPAVTHVRFPDSRSGYEWFTKSGFTRALFVSDGLRAPAVAEAPALFGTRSEILHDGVLLPELPGPAGRLALKRELGLPEDRPTVVIAGQVVKIKGIWEFLAAAEQLLTARVKVAFAVLGDDLKGNGAVRREAEAHVRTRGLGAAVHFLGFRPDAPRLIPAFDLVAVPSHVEPLGNATLEAMAAARPVVGSRVGGIPEMVADGVTGLLVPPGDSAALAEAIASLVGDPVRLEAFGQAGRARAETHFSMQVHATRLQGIYDAITAQR
jgi:glycosyltransferase involved in cell wall biosynthesis